MEKLFEAPDYEALFAEMFSAIVSFIFGILDVFIDYEPQKSH